MKSLDLARKPVNELAYIRLKELILSGEIAMGERLNEQELAQGMKISRTPLREAITRLAQEGLVEYRPYQGNFARHYTPKEVRDLYSVRKTLEAMAIRLATENLSDQDLAAIEAVLDQAHAALDAEDIAGFSEADSRFHRMIAVLSDNEKLQDFLRQIESQIELVRRLGNREEEVLTRTPGERERILAALTGRNGEAAAQLMIEHIESVERTVVEKVENLSRGELGDDPDTGASVAAG